MQVGHLTHGEQSYLKGLNSWIFANGVIYPNNNKQLIMIIPDGKKVYWRL
jgi:hypothetical protein